MRLDWIVIETFAVLIENFATLYFVNSRHTSKYESLVPHLLAWVALSAVGLCAVFIGFPIGIYEVAILLFLLVFLCYVKHGGLGQKILSLIILSALVVGTTLLGAGLASVLTNVHLGHSILYQDTTRMFSLIFVKSLQVVILLSLARKRPNTHVMKRKTSILFIFAIVMLFVCNFLIYASIQDFDYTQNMMLIWLTFGLLSIMIILFMLYELFVREESSNLDLSIKLQRFELENHFYKEVDEIHSEIRLWKHEYNNNLIVLRKLIKHSKNVAALKYIDNINHNARQNVEILQTGNLVLDAVVSSKLWSACSQGIDVSVHAVYPENCNVEDNDLCAIAGNLLDNALEACMRMSDADKTKFVTFSLLTKGKNMIITISNSYDGEIKKEGGRFITCKDKRFHGIGIKHVTSIIEKYRGYIQMEYADGIFETNVLIPIVFLQEEK